MFRPLRFALSGTLLFAVLFVVTLLLPASARAIQLRWSTGSTDLTALQNTQAVLVVQADSAESVLPNSWRLQWTADSLGVQFSVFDPNSACLVDTAKVDSIVPPQTAADSSANQITAYFCSSGGSNASTAHFLVDVPGGGHGKMKIVGLDAADTTHVIESNETTYNGGVDGDYSAAVLSTSWCRVESTIQIQTLGSGLGSVRSASLVGPADSWTVPLSVTHQSPSALTAQATVPAALPASSLRLEAGSGRTAVANTSGDTPLEPDLHYSYGSFVSPSPSTWRPKDFSIFYDNLGHFHLFFMRTATSGTSDSVESVIGHVTSSDLQNWTATPELTLPTLSTPPLGQAHRWDEAHVWAPSLLQMGSNYYLFYTGVDAQGNQSIGYATTSNINVPQIAWTRHDQPVFRVSDAQFTDLSGATPLVCRDPYVMEDPFTPGQLHMWFAAAPPASIYAKAIGIAHASATTLTNWTYDGRMAITPHVPTLTDKTESPHAFLHKNLVTGDSAYFVLTTGNDTAPPKEVGLLRNRTAPWDISADSSATHWNLHTTLYDQLGFGAYNSDELVFNGWEATEYCKFAEHEYIAGINATPGNSATYAIWIAMIGWVGGLSGAPDEMVLQNPVTDVQATGTAGRTLEPGLRLASMNPQSGLVVFEAAIGKVEGCQLDVFDAAGRHVRRLLSGTLTPGIHRATWDGRGESGVAANPGLYFARLSHGPASNVVRLVRIR